MDIAKSFFGSRDHEGYVGKEEHAVSNNFVTKFYRIVSAICYEKFHINFHPHIPIRINNTKLQHDI